MLAVSPLAAMRSAPTTTQSTLPPFITCPAMLSVITVTGISSFASSHAVRRAPCRKGRVSSAMTATRLPASRAPRMTPRAVPYRGRQCPRVAVREHGRAVGDQLAAEATEGAVRLDVLAENTLRLFDESLLDLVHLRARGFRAAEGVAHALDGPEEVDGRRARAAHHVAEEVEVLFEVGDRGDGRLLGAERNAHRGRHPDGGRAAHDHLLDGVGHLLARAQSQIFSSVGSRRWSIMRTPSSVHSTVLIMARFDSG